MTAKGIGLLLALCLGGCRGKSSPAPEALPAANAVPQVAEIGVPMVTGPVKCDGELSEPDWQRATRTGAFVMPGGAGPARPLSEARLLHDERYLYLGLYAADENIRPAAATHDGPVWTGDSFSIRVLKPVEVRIDLSPAGVVTDAKVGPPIDPTWESGTVLGVDMDGTSNDERDEDEEWVVEAAIPIASLCEGARCADVRLQLSRCDTLREGRRVCASWGGASTRLRLE